MASRKMMESINLSEVLCKHETILIPKHIDFWDYNGTHSFENRHYSQSDWNYTLLTVINKISNNIHKSCGTVSANTIEVNLPIFSIISDWGFTHTNGDGEIIINDRYRVKYNIEIENNLIIIYYDCPDELKFRTEYESFNFEGKIVQIPKNNYYGLIKVLNLPF